jgi:phospholipase C
MFVVFAYDEHGGFFDHVPPLDIPYAPPPNASYTTGFTTTGARVPVIVASPFVSTKAFNGAMDHTSILQFLAERFEPGGPGYSPSVNARRAAGINSLSALLTTPTTPTAIAAAPSPPSDTFSIESVLGQLPITGMGPAFVEAGHYLMKSFPTDARAALPELWHLLR